MSNKLNKDLFEKIMTDLEAKATYNESVYLTAIREVLESYVEVEEPKPSPLNLWSI